MATTKDKVITIDLPGKFDSFFSGSSVGQGQTDMKVSGYPGAPGLYKAYTEARHIKRGKGYSLRLTIPVDEHTRDVLDCLWDYADTCAVVNQDAAYDSTGSPEDRNDAYGEMVAGRKVCERVTALLLDLEEGA